MTRRLEELSRAIRADSSWLERVGTQGRITVAQRLDDNRREAEEIVHLAHADTEEVVVMKRKREPITTRFRRPGTEGQR